LKNAKAFFANARMSFVLNTEQFNNYAEKIKNILRKMKENKREMITQEKKKMP
jgi:hypothetical protein